MNVTLPNGKIISNVPDGTPKEAIMAKAISSGLAVESDFGVQQEVVGGAVDTDIPAATEQPAQPTQPKEVEVAVH